MMVFIFIVGLAIILWPVLGGTIAALFNGAAIIISLPIYWTMRIIKRPKDEKEELMMTKASGAASMFTILHLLLGLLIYSSFL